MNKSEKFELLGVELEWKLTDTETGNRYCVLEAIIPPGVMVPPHRHPDQEAFLILDGAPEFASEGPNGLEWCFAVPGETINVPSMSLHGTPNLGRFFEDAGLPYYNESPHRSRIPTFQQVQRVLEIGERYGHVYSDEEPGPCKRTPAQFAIRQLLTLPTISSLNRAYLF
jgi:quercetin dioxygenase-like cupin family protein